MRSRILRVAVVAVAVAVLFFAVPLAFAVHQLFDSEERNRLEREALTAAVDIDPDDLAGPPSRIALPKTRPGTSIGVYDSTGRLRVGKGPRLADDSVNAALHDQVGKLQDADELVVAVPIPSGDAVIGAVRASTAPSVVWMQTAKVWAAMLALAALAVALAAAVAQRQARRLSRPLQDLAHACEELGEGDFTVRTTRSGVAEIDQAGSALDVTAHRLGRLVARERRFAGNVSHQLRTPLTSLRLGLEQALAGPDADLEEVTRRALRTAARLEATVDDLLELQRAGEFEVGDPVSATDLMDPLRARWESTLLGLGRALELQVSSDAPRVAVPARMVNHALDVLVDNAIQHGQGRVLVRCRSAGGALAVDVEDEGPGVALPPDLVFRRGVSGADGHGIGLAMARELVEAVGGRLDLTRSTPTAVFTMLLPGFDDDADIASSGPSTSDASAEDVAAR